MTLVTLAPFDQAAELRAAMRANRIGDLAAITQVVAPLPAFVPEPAPRSAAVNPSRVVAIASGKGGVGKTHIAVNLALLLGRMGRRVLLIDLDVGTANIDVLLNLQPVATIADYLTGRCPSHRLPHSIAPGVRFIASPSGEARYCEQHLSDASRLSALLAAFAGAADTLLLDCGAGVGPLVRNIAAQADLLAVVATPEPTAIADAYALIKVTQGDRAGRLLPGRVPDDERRSSASPSRRVLIVNQVADAREGQEVAGRIASTARRFLGVEVPLAGHVRSDRHVLVSGARRQPFTESYPRCRASQDLTTLATQLDRLLPVSGDSRTPDLRPIAAEATPEVPHRESFIRRIFS